VSSAGAADVALDARLTRQMSVGMRAYAQELSARLPRVAPDLSFRSVGRGENFTLDEQLRFPLELAWERPRLTHFLSLYAPLFAPRRFAITIHDLIHLRYPELFKAKVGPYYRVVVRSLCARAERVITDDWRTVADLERFLGVPPAKVRVIALGVDDVFLGEVAPEPAPRPYFLYVGNHRPHKDLATAFAAWEALPEDLEADFVVTGRDDLAAHARRPVRARGTLRFAGDLERARLARACRGAAALVHPAWCEGFGLPMLEAAALGTRVLACADAVPGVLRPYVGVFAARDVRTLRDLMAGVLSGASGLDVERAKTFARTHSWDRCAAATAEVYREVLAEGRSR
jgi:glycosyltransferase involved in cell wall biosynthesis